MGPFAHPIVRVSGAAEQLDEASSGLPAGPARAEAIAVRLRRAGADLEWGPPCSVADLRALIELSRARGASSVEMLRSDPSLVTEMQIGGCFHAYWRTRVLRRVLCRTGIPRSGKWTPLRFVRSAADAAFWTGVMSIATREEWERFVKSSYLVLYYHSIAGKRTPGHAHLDVHPRRFERQLRVLRRLGLRPLSPDELLAFHSDPSATIAGRRYVLAADDGIADTVSAFRRHLELRPQMFVCTEYVGRTSVWSDDAPIAGWEELGELGRLGGHVGSHSRGHTPLTELAPDVLGAELAGALRDLESHLSRFTRFLAYPHGAHDQRVRSAAIEAGYEAAFTTEPGRNGAGTDPYCLRRIELKDWDGAFLLVWTALTGEPLPWKLERLRRWVKRVRATRTDARTPQRTVAS